MRSLGVLCARGSSKRLPRKHLLPLQGVPLVAWMCRAAAASSLSRVVLTTEDAEIAKVAMANGVEVPFVRPSYLAEDYAADADIVGHALDFCERQEGDFYDVVVMLQPTTPLTQPEDIDGCLQVLAANPTIACCFTARRVTEPPQWMFIREESGRAIPLLEGIGNNQSAHQQLLSATWFPSGAAYAVRVSALRVQNKIYATPLALQPVDSERSIDIDEETDLIMAEKIAALRGYSPLPLNNAPRFVKEGI